MLVSASQLTDPERRLGALATAAGGMEGGQELACSVDGHMKWGDRVMIKGSVLSGQRWQWHSRVSAGSGDLEAPWGDGGDVRGS